MNIKTKDGAPYKVVRCHFYDDSGRAIYPYCAEGSTCRFIHPYDKEWPGLPPRSRFYSTMSGSRKRSASPTPRGRSPSGHSFPGHPSSYARRRRSLSPLPKKPRYDEPASMKGYPGYRYHDPSGYHSRSDNHHRRVETVKPKAPDLKPRPEMEPPCMKEVQMKDPKVTAHTDQQLPKDVSIYSNCSRAHFEPPQPTKEIFGVITLIGKLAKAHLRLLDDKKALEEESLKLEAFESLAAKFDIKEDSKKYENIAHRYLPTTQTSTSSKGRTESLPSDPTRDGDQSSHGIDGQSMAHMALIGTLDSIQQRKLKTEQRIKEDYEEMASILQEIWVDTFTSAAESTQGILSTQRTSLLEKNANEIPNINPLESGGNPAKKHSISSDEWCKEFHKKGDKTSRTVSFRDEAGKSANEKDALRALEEKLSCFEKKISKFAGIEKDNSKLKSELKSQKDEIHDLKKALNSQGQKLATLIEVLPNSTGQNSSGAEVDRFSL